MPTRLLKLFQSTPSGSKDGLTQAEREAIADLLHFCMYADNHLAAAEAKVIDDVVATFDWDPKVAFETYESRSVNNARRAKEDANYRDEFLKSIATRLGSTRGRELARSVSKKLFLADGENSTLERELAEALDRVLK